MTLPRRQFLHFAVAAASAAGASAFPLARSARAQSYPTRPVHIILGFPAGGSSDVIGRLMAQRLSERLGQPFVFDNRPGAGSNIGTEMVANAEPDGYTVLWAASPNAINATLYDNLNFNFIRDFAPVAGVFRVPNVMEINPALPVNNVAEFIAYAKTNPGAINFASGGIGSTQHLAGELFKFMTGIDIRHVPYRGSVPALVDLLSGQVQVMFDLMPSSIGYIRAGKLRALAVTTAMRSNALPDVPAVAEFVPGYEASTWNGVVVPQRTPRDVVETLAAEITAGLADAGIEKRFADLGAEPMPMPPAEFGKFIAAETGKWAKVIAFANVKAD